MNSLFIGCFIALITTAFGFVGRLALINVWAKQFNLDPAQAGRLAGIGIWPFAVSIILFSLFIDKIGYKVAMFVAFFGHLIWTAMGVSAYFIGQDPANSQLAYQLLYWGSLILALANGTVEAFINPVVATIYSKQKTKWLNILHAGWPGGLVISGLLVIFMGNIEWSWKVGIIGIPTVLYGVLLFGVKFPVSERVASGVSYREMLQEFGILGACVVGFLLTLQLMDFFKPLDAPLPDGQKRLFIGIGIAMVVAFGLYTRRLGRPIMFLLILIMMPLATTEIGTDGWITAIMERVLEDPKDAPWVLVYTSAIMLVLRFFAGPIVHSLSPLGLLTVSAVLAVLGLYTLSVSPMGWVLFASATLYGLGKTFFWPTMLGVVSEQCPRGGALTLNAISGIGMLAVGTLGFPYIGKLQVDTEKEAIVESAEIGRAVPALFSAGETAEEKLSAVLEERDIYEIIKYTRINESKLGEVIASLSADARPTATEEIKRVREKSSQKALGSMTIFPIVMLAGYLALLAYFRAKGGYKVVEIGGAH
jgi:MFS family permease